MTLKHPASKGKRGEYFVRDLLKGYGFDARRTPMSGAIDGWKGDITAPTLPFFVEVKNTEKTKFLEWYKKANDQTTGKPPIIIWTHKGEAYGFLLLSDLLQLLTAGIITPKQFKKPKKAPRQSLDETANLPFSKAKQLRQ